jgi:hypothetical protein
VLRTDAQGKAYCLRHVRECRNLYLRLAFRRGAALLQSKKGVKDREGVRDVVRPATVRLRPNPGQRNGKNLCRSHPRTKESLDPLYCRFQEHLNLILDEVRRNFSSRGETQGTHPFLGRRPGASAWYSVLLLIGSGALRNQPPR